MVAELSFIRPLKRDEPFSVLLRALRVRRGLSQNQLARQAGINPAYVNRLERASVDSINSPSRRIVLSLWKAVGGGTDDRERLLVAAGHCPEVILLAGGWDGYRETFRARMDEAVLALEAAFRGDLT